MGEMKEGEDDLVEAVDDETKRVRIRDLESVFLDKGTIIGNSDFIEAKENPHHLDLCSIGITSEINELAASVLPDRSYPTITRCSSSSFEGSSNCLFQHNATKTQFPIKSGNDAKVSDTNDTKEVFPMNIDSSQESNKLASPLLAVDLKSIDLTTMANPDLPQSYKRLDHVMSPESECGSTTGISGHSGPLKDWNNMKQNGFFSISHGGIPLPKQHTHEIKKRKDVDLRKNIEITKKTQSNRFAKTSPPSGLLSGLNPGIINHVRNRKQVHSIIEAMVGSEKLEDQSDEGSKGIIDRIADHDCMHDSMANRFSMPLSSVFSMPECKGETSGVTATQDMVCSGNNHPCFTSETKSDELVLKLSSSGVMVSGNASGASNYANSASQETVHSLSLRGATVASQWLELLYQDIRGRLAALKRSRKRVRNVIQTELPYLISEEHMPMQGSIRYPDADENLEMHVIRWKTIFSQMDKTLYEEGKQLESWLEQVKEMQVQCGKGLKSAKGDGMPLPGSSDFTMFKSSEELEGESAVMAAAASIYSTCNLAMSADNVSCF